MGSLASYRGFAFKPVTGHLPTGNAVVFMKGPALGLNIAINGPMATVIANPADPSARCW
jgi:cellulose synthase (UDP-forming)